MNARSTALVLIVEDSDEDFDTAREAVMKSGLAAEIRRATNGDECRAHVTDIRAEPPRPVLILLDLNTPGSDCREALVWMKQEEAIKSYPVVVLTTSINPKDVAYCYARGANAYHVKPVSYVDHLRVVSDLLSYWFRQAVPPHADLAGSLTHPC